jgi:MFS family permease
VGTGTTQAGLLLASIPLGGAVGAVLLVRFVRRDRRMRVAGAMAIGCGLPLIVTAAEPAWPIAWLCWFVSGALAAFQVEVTTSIVQAIPDRSRARLVGMASSWLVGAQGVGLLVFGAIANATGAGRSIALAAVVGVVFALLLVLGPLRSSQDRAEPGARPGVPPGRPWPSPNLRSAPYLGRHGGAAPDGAAKPFVVVDPGTSSSAGSGSGSGAEETGGR